MSSSFELRRSWVPLVERKALQETGTGVTVELGGLRLAVFWIDGRAHVLDDECPHQGASLGGGVVRDGEVTCPWHGWRFSIRDGSSTDGLACRIAVYEARENGTWIEASLPVVP